MKEIQVFLIPQPGAKPEFLATVIPVDPSPIVSKVWAGLFLSQSQQASSNNNSKVVLEGYTRDGWAWKPSPNFTNLRVRSTDGRNKLKGFVKYLADRQKSAFGRFVVASPGSGGGCGIWAVSYIQSNAKETDRMDCRISLDMGKIKGCPLKPLAAGSNKQQPQKLPAAQQPPAAAAASAARKKKGGGLLGQLVGAQQKTNRHMEATSKKAKQPAAAAAVPASGAGRGGDQAAAGASAASAAIAGGASAPPPPSALRTAAQVLSEFRQSMQDKMLDFDIQDDEQLKVSVSLGEQTAGLTTEDKEKVTMEILKYMVYEAAEEVNEEWIAYKEPAEFLDESNFTIYKEGAAPPEVLEEVNKGELPDEVRAEQRAMTMERQRQVAQAESKKHRQVMQEAHDARKYDDGDEEGEMEALNANKRDRRTIEDYEREKSAKRSRR